MNNVVLGGGLAGLGALSGFRAGEDVTLFEKGFELGGILSQGVTSGGFKFDLGGHWLHVKAGDPKEEWIAGLLRRDGWVKHERKAYCALVNGDVYPYPVQQRVNMLPRRLVQSMMDAAAGRVSDSQVGMSLRSWLPHTFGDLAEQFLVPYNEKVWGPWLHVMEAGRQRIPVLTIKELQDALQGKRFPVGYNVEFWYPPRGGIERLVYLLERETKGGEIRLETEIVRIDMEDRVLWYRRGGYRSLLSMPYDRMVSTIPLPVLAACLRSRSGIVDGKIRELVDVMSSYSPKQYVYMLGGMIPGGWRVPVDAQWLYVSDPGLRVHRIGWFSRVCPAMAPAGWDSLYVEVNSHLAADGGPPLWEHVEKELAHVLGYPVSDMQLSVKYGPVEIPWAYPVHYRELDAHRQELYKLLGHNGIMLAGRFGAWKYLGMAETYVDGYRASEGFA